jgi:hypothetical protein
VPTAKVDRKEEIMSYTKRTWGDGDVITADRLNNMEDGIDEALKSAGLDADEMSYIAILQESDALMVYDLPDKVMAKITWKTLKSLIASALEGVVYAAGIIDPDSGSTATVPHFEDNAVLLTEEDIPRIAEEVKKSLSVWEGGSY